MLALRGQKLDNDNDQFPSLSESWESCLPHIMVSFVLIPTTVRAFGCPLRELQGGEEEEGGGNHLQKHLNAIILDCDGTSCQQHLSNCKL